MKRRAEAWARACVAEVGYCTFVNGLCWLEPVLHDVSGRMNLRSIYVHNMAPMSFKSMSLKACQFEMSSCLCVFSKKILKLSQTQPWLLRNDTRMPNVIQADCQNSSRN